VPTKAPSKGIKLPKGNARYLVFAGMAVVAFLVYRHFKGQQSTSAGSSSVPQPASASLPAPLDSTGGGASGSGANDLGNLYDLLGQETGALLASNQTFADAFKNYQPTNTTTSTTTNYTYYPSTGQPDTGGGNTSPKTDPTAPTIPDTSHPFESNVPQIPGTTTNVAPPQATSVESFINSVNAGQQGPQTAPTYGLTYGPAAGKRATKDPKRGTLTIH
jgi:hypothetical protein